MKYQCTKCGLRRVAGRPVKATCKDFEISDARTPKDPVKRNSVIRAKLQNLYSHYKRKKLSLKKFHKDCPPNYHKYDFVPTKKTIIKET